MRIFLAGFQRLSPNFFVYHLASILKMLESLNTALEVASAILLGLTFIVGTGAIFTSHVLNKRQEERIALVQKDTADANNRAGVASQRASEADERAKGLVVMAETLRQQNIATELALEKERTTRLGLEQSLTPRQIPLIFKGAPRDGKSNVDSLRLFPGMNAIVEVLPDAEARRAASDMVFLLKEAKWNVVSASLNPSLEIPHWDGVTIEHRTYPGVPTPEAKADHAQQAAETLLIFLRANNWDRIRTRPVFPDKHDEIAANTVRISVGFKPSPYFDPDWDKKADKQIEDALGRTARIIEERKRIEELLTAKP
jgi:hypothetical protein